MFISKYDYTLETMDRLLDYQKCFDFGGYQLDGGAFIYVGSSFEHYSSAGDYGVEMKKTMPIKAQVSVLARRIAEKLGRVDYMSISANACASGLSAIHEARGLLDRGEYEEVVLYGEELTVDMQRLMFKQMKIDIEFASGAFIMKLSNKPSLLEIPDSVWKYDGGSHPFDVTVNGYDKVISPLAHYQIDAAKGHFSTYANDKAEEAVIERYFQDARKFRIKDEIGHSQGISAIIEMLYMVDNYKFNNALITSSGLGGFYGSCIIKRRNS